MRDTNGILPTSFYLSPDLLNTASHPFASGGYGDMSEGTLDGSKVRIKRVRVYTRDDTQEAINVRFDVVAFPVCHLQRSSQAFCREAVTWEHLKHRNILPLLGITVAPLQLVSHWMSGGDLREYIKKNPSAHRVGLVGSLLLCLSHTYYRRQLSDAAEGLCYLHSCDVVHGDLKGVCVHSEPHFSTVLTSGQPNILVDNSGNPRIADFGLATVTQNLDPMGGTSRQLGCTPRWAAPEVLNEDRYSKEADIFSFAMVMIEVRRR